MKKLSSYIIPLIVSFALCFLILIVKDIFNQDTTKEIMHILADAFFVPGVVMICTGLLVFTSNEGTFDMLAYGVTKLIDLFRSDATRNKHKSFYDYSVAKHEEKSRFGHLLIIGLAFLGLSIIFTLVYYYN